jgi:hypothetical protein
MGIKVKTTVRYLSGMTYWDLRTVDKLAVSKVGDDTVCLEFEDAGVIVGSMSFPASIAPVLTKALLIVAEGNVVRLDVQLP